MIISNIPECAYGEKLKIVASSDPPDGEVPIQLLYDSAKQKSLSQPKPSNPPSGRAEIRL